jgi:hypothetical protein
MSFGLISGIVGTAVKIVIAMMMMMMTTMMMMTMMTIMIDVI